MIALKNHVNTVEKGTSKVSVQLKTKLAINVVKLGEMIRNSVFSGREQFFPGTQAFASPPYMASSGVWENIILLRHPHLMVHMECFHI